ncbi:MAG: hypothetical protein ABI614_13080 [Planctomycetota bacterium]
MRPLIRFRLRSLFIAMSLIAMAAAFVARLRSRLPGCKVHVDPTGASMSAVAAQAKTPDEA